MMLLAFLFSFTLSLLHYAKARQDSRQISLILNGMDEVTLSLHIKFSTFTTLGSLYYCRIFFRGAGIFVERNLGVKATLSVPLGQRFQVA